MKTAIVIGATGLVGRECVKLLLEDKEFDKVITLVRKRGELNHPKLKEVVIDFDHAPSYQEFLKADSLFCCLGTTIKKAGSKDDFSKVDYFYPMQFATIAKEEGTDNLVIISAMGANKNSPIFYNKVKGEMEEEIKKIGFKSVTIVRPSLLVGEREEFRLGERIAISLTRPLSFLMLGPLTKYKPVKVTQVAKAMVSASKVNNGGVQIWESNRLQAF